MWSGEQPFHHQVLAEVRGGGWTTGPLDEHGVPAADMADGNPNGYYFITFDGNEYRPRFKPASLPEDFQMRITLRGGEGNHVLANANGVPVWIPEGPSGSHGISPWPRFHAGDWDEEHWPAPGVEVNVFDGGSRHQVEVRFDGRKFAPMDYTPPRFGLTDGDPTGNLDSYIRALREQLEGSERPVDPEPSSHLWTVHVPRNLGPGVHSVTIRSTDPCGEVSETSQRFEILTGRPPVASAPIRSERVPE